MVRKRTSKKEPIIVSWLRRIFSAQSISIILGFGGCVGAYYAYKEYKAHQPAQVSMYIVKNTFLGIRDGFYPEKNLFLIEYLRYPICNDTITWYDDHGPLLFRNETNKSIKDFRAEVTIYHPSIISLNLNDISKDYEIIKCDTNCVLDRKIIYLRYRYDVLTGHTNLPAPISKMIIGVDSNLYNEEITFEYSITYDGIKEPILCCINNYVNHDSCAGDEGRYPDKVLEDFLDSYYSSYKNLSKERDKILAVIETSWWANREIIPPKKYIDEPTFEQAKKRILEDGVDYYSVYKIKEDNE